MNKKQKEFINNKVRTFVPKGLESLTKTETKKIQKQLKQTDYLLNSLSALGYAPMITHKGGLHRKGTHILFSDGVTHLYYDKKTNTYKGMIRK